ncbi:MAG: VWA domain-containing protein [Candidatus Lokiarchaeota archaeon]|nr:VWA domain-containing protein [Candidatus Lokiarchaeota archaeon]
MSEKLGQLDCIFVVDNTGSMGPYIQTVQEKIIEIIRTIKKEELVHRLRVGVVSYRDHPPEENTFVVQFHHLTNDTKKIEEAVRSMSASGGGDGPEAVADGIEAAMRMEYLSDAAKVMILIGDAPPHGVEDSDRWRKCPEGISWEMEIQKAFEKGIVIHSVGCFPEIARYQNAVKTFETIARTTKGNFFPLNKAELLVELITGIAVEEVDKIAIQQQILEDLGVSVDELPADEELTADKIAALAVRLRSKGVTRRAVHHTVDMSAAAGAPKAETVEVAEKELDEEDVKEAIRQLRKKR